MPVCASTTLRSVIPIDAHVFLRRTCQYKHSRAMRTTHVAEIASPVLCTLGAKPELDLDLQVLLANDLLCTRLVDLLGLAVNEQRQGRSTVSGDERDVHAGRFNGLGEGNRAGSSEDAAPAVAPRSSAGSSKRGPATHFASSPNSAVLTSAEVEMRDATACASLYVGAPSTVTVTNFVAPSPSRTTS